MTYHKNENEEFKQKKKMSKSPINTREEKTNMNEIDNQKNKENMKINEITIVDFIQRMRNEKRKNDNIEKKESNSKSCDQCNFTATNTTTLKTHIESVHEQRIFKCNKCDYKAKNKPTLKTHMDSVHEQRKFECNKCDYKAKDKPNLEKHIESQHTVNTYECDITSTQNMIHDSRVRRNLNGKEIHCENCDFTSKSMTLLTLHTNGCMKHKETLFKKQNKTKENQGINANKGKRIHCEKCEKKFNKEQTYEAHIKKYHEEYNNNKKLSQVNLNLNLNQKICTEMTSPVRTRSLRSNKKNCSA